MAVKKSWKFPGFVFIYINFINTVHLQQLIRMWKGYHLSIEGIQEGYLFQALKKFSSSNLVQLNFLAGQVTFEAHLPNE